MPTTRIKFFQTSDWSEIEETQRAVNKWIGDRPEVEIVTVRTMPVDGGRKFLTEVIYRASLPTDGII